MSLGASDISIATEVPSIHKVSRDHSTSQNHHGRSSVPKRERVPHHHPVVPLEPEKEGWPFPEGCVRKAEEHVESSDRLWALTVL